jgi:hypothetical protein
LPHARIACRHRLRDDGTIIAATRVASHRIGPTLRRRLRADQSSEKSRRPEQRTRMSITRPVPARADAPAARTGHPAGSSRRRPSALALGRLTPAARRGRAPRRLELLPAGRDARARSAVDGHSRAAAFRARRPAATATDPERGVRDRRDGAVRRRLAGVRDLGRPVSSPPGARFHPADTDVCGRTACRGQGAPGHAAPFETSSPRSGSPLCAKQDGSSARMPAAVSCRAARHTSSTLAASPRPKSTRWR